ncbi:hypothetical protein D3D01_18910 [Haloarcula sp. Atlit-7R]|nr:hypothetical protein D3D01_18910 [Haloarcula sp. Atlit-7R]
MPHPLRLNRLHILLVIPTLWLRFGFLSQTIVAAGRNLIRPMTTFTIQEQQPARLVAKLTKETALSLQTTSMRYGVLSGTTNSAPFYRGRSQMLQSGMAERTISTGLLCTICNLITLLFRFLMWIVGRISKQVTKIVSNERRLYGNSCNLVN